MQWRVELHQDGHGRLACLDLDAELISQVEPKPSFFEVCSSVSAPVRLVTYSVQRKGKSLTLLAGILAPRVVRLELRAGNGSKVVPVVRRLSSAVSQRLGLPRLRYIRVAFPKEFCYTHALGSTVRGRVVYEGASTC
jgi:hypothetical protein